MTRYCFQPCMILKDYKISHPYITFNTVLVARTTCQKHFDLYLDEKSSFYDHINANKGIAIIKSFQIPFHKTTS